METYIHRSGRSARSGWSYLSERYPAPACCKSMNLAIAVNSGNEVIKNCLKIATAWRMLRDVFVADVGF